MPVPSSRREIFMESGNESSSSIDLRLSANVSHALDWHLFLALEGSLSGSLVDC